MPACGTVSVRYLSTRRSDRSAYLTSLWLLLVSRWTKQSSGIRFASGRAQGIHVWGLLARRSNGRTTRTVLLGGKPTVMQVVELHVVLQNMGQRPVRLTDAIAVRADASGSSFAPFGLSSGAHLTPHVLSVNDDVCATKDIASVALHHGDVCVLGVFLQCPGLDLEQEFLQRCVFWLCVHLSFWAEVSNAVCLLCVFGHQCIVLGRAVCSRCRWLKCTWRC